MSPDTIPYRDTISTSNCWGPWCESPDSCLGLAPRLNCICSTHSIQCSHYYEYKSSNKNYLYYVSYQLSSAGIVSSIRRPDPFPRDPIILLHPPPMLETTKRTYFQPFQQVRQRPESTISIMEQYLLPLAPPPSLCCETAPAKLPLFPHTSCFHHNPSSKELHLTFDENTHIYSQAI